MIARVPYLLRSRRGTVTLTTSTSSHLPPSHRLLRERYGYAHFDSLYIKEAGIDYKLGFTATGLTSTFSGDTYVESSMFTVGVGPAYRLELEDDILGGTIVSGSPFEEQVAGPTQVLEELADG